MLARAVRLREREGADAMPNANDHLPKVEKLHPQTTTSARPGDAEEQVDGYLGQDRLLAALRGDQEKRTSTARAALKW